MREKKVIAIVANSTWNIHNFRMNVLRCFIDAGYRIVVLAPVDEYISYKETFPEVRHINLRLMDRDSTNPIKDFLLTLELIKKYRIVKPDLVLHYTNKPNIFGGVSAFIVGLDSIAIVTGLGYAFINNRLIKKIITFLYTRTSKFHKKFIFENLEDREFFENEGIIPRGKGVSIKGCGVNTNYFSPRKIKLPKSNKMVFTFIGRLLYDKGVKEFVDVARLLKPLYSNMEFWIIGELDPENPSTVDRDELNEWVEEGVITYHGFKRDIRPYIAKSSCVVLPSYREAIPRAITEAMSMEKAVITTNVAGCREAVNQDVNGYLVEPKSVESLRSAMVMFYNLTEEERQIMGKEGRKIVLKEFDDNIIANKILEISKLILHEQ